MINCHDVDRIKFYVYAKLCAKFQASTASMVTAAYVHGRDFGNFNSVARRSPTDRMMIGLVC